MAQLLKQREAVKSMLVERVKEGKDVAAKVAVVEKTAGYREWLHLFANWRKATIAELRSAYDGDEVAKEFANSTVVYFSGGLLERLSPGFTFSYRKEVLPSGIAQLEILIDRLALVAPESEGASAIKSLHREIYSRCSTLYNHGDYVEAVEKSFKVVRDRLRDLTGHETGSDAFGDRKGKGNLYVNGAAARHVDDDFQDGVKFLCMAIDRFRNEKSHTADGNITDRVRAYEYLRLSSLAMHMLDNAVVRHESTDKSGSGTPENDRSR